MLYYFRRQRYSFLIYTRTIHPNFAPFREDKDCYLAVFYAEADGSGEGILGKETGTVKIVETVGGVESAAHVAVVPHCVAYYPTQLFAGVAALRGSVRDNNAFRGLPHRGDVHREAVGMTDAVRPHAVSHGPHTSTAHQLAVAVAGGEQQGADQKHRSQHVTSKYIFLHHEG